MDVTAKSEADRDALRFAMNLSLAVGLLMFVMKTGAYLLTGSAAILSDAAESVTHLAAVFFAAYGLQHILVWYWSGEVCLYRSDGHR